MKRTALLLVMVAVGTARAQNGVVAETHLAPEADASPRLVTWNEGVQILELAWQNVSRFDSAIDCSHLVNDIYELAGLHYAYANSNELYHGLEGFKRVRTPQPADLIVWPGHVGLVVNPRAHSFYSLLSTGPKLDTYDAPAWRARGRAHFLRFLIPAGEHVRSASNQALAAAARSDQNTLHDSQSDRTAPVSPSAAGSSRPTSEQPSDAIFLDWERPDKDAIENLLLQTWSDASDDRQDRWEQAPEVVIVETLKVQRIHLSGAKGTLEAKIKSAARLTPHGMLVHSSTDLVNFHLVHSQNGWKIEDPSGRMYLSGDAAVVAVSERLAGIARENASRDQQAQVAGLLQSILR
jgi:hypothetical protein